MSTFLYLDNKYEFLKNVFEEKMLVEQEFSFSKDVRKSAEVECVHFCFSWQLVDYWRLLNLEQPTLIVTKSAE